MGQGASSAPMRCPVVQSRQRSALPFAFKIAMASGFHLLTLESTKIREDDRAMMLELVNETGSLPNRLSQSSDANIYSKDLAEKLKSFKGVCRMHSLDCGPN